MVLLSFFTKVWKGRRRIEFNRTQGLFFGFSETEVFVGEFIWCFSILLAVAVCFPSGWVVSG